MMFRVSGSWQVGKCLNPCTIASASSKVQGMVMSVKMLMTFSMKLSLSLFSELFKFSVSQHSYGKSLAFGKEDVVYMMTSKFMTLMINLIEENFCRCPHWKKGLLRHYICEIFWKFQSHFVTLIFGNCPGSSCTYTVKSINLLPTGVAGFLTPGPLVKCLLSTHILHILLNFMSSDSCTESPLLLNMPWRDKS